MEKLYRWANVLGLVFVLIINVLAELLPLGGKTTGEISSQYPAPIVPAGYAFSIWTVIYGLLMGFVIYTFTKRGRESGAVLKIGFFFAFSCLFNSAWLFTWHYEKLIGSVIMMFSLLMSLFVIYIRVNVRSNHKVTAAYRWLVVLPFSLYLGWICVAAIVNAASVLYAFEWDGFGLSDTAWGIIMLTIAALLALWIGLRYTDPALVLVFVWAFAAITVKQRAYPAVADTSLIFAILLAVFMLFLINRKKKALLLPG